MKAHVGVDSKTKLVHSAAATPGQRGGRDGVARVVARRETGVWGDQAYRGQGETIRELAPRAKDLTHKRYRYKNRVDEVERKKNREKSRVRSRVEHVFGVMKLKFGFTKVRYRGMVTNANRMLATFALVNLYMVRKQLLRQGA